MPGARASNVQDLGFDMLVSSASTAMTFWLQKLTRKKALGTGPNSAWQAEYALDGNVLITVLKVQFDVASAPA